MAFINDPVTALNMALCVIIMILGSIGHVKKRDDIFSYIAIAFGLFGATHLLTLLGLKTDLEGVIISIRMAAYILVAFALLKKVREKD